MKIQEFIERLKQLGFTDIPWTGTTPEPSDPWLKCFDPPERLRAVIYALNIGGTGTVENRQYDVTFQAQTDAGRAGDEDLGGMCPCVDADEQLLTALQGNSAEFLRWFNNRSAYSFRAKDEKGNDLTQGIVTRDGTAHVGPKSVN